MIYKIVAHGMLSKGISGLPLPFPRT